MRRPKSHTGNEDQDIGPPAEEERVPFMMDMTIRNKALPSAPELLALKPSKVGFAEKENTSWLARWFSCWYPKFKRRYFILIGNYLFRYSSELGESPKGVPIPLDAVTVKVLEDSNCFQVSTLRKDYTIRTANSDECLVWVRAIKDRKAAAIRENMGHVSISPEIAAINRKASKLFNDRIKKDRLANDNSNSNSIMNPLQYAGR